MRAGSGLQYFSLTLFALILSGFISCGQEGMGLNRRGAPGTRGTDGGSAPSYQPVTPHTELRGESNLSLLLQRGSRGQVQTTPWSGYWWPYAENGIRSAAAKYDRANPGAGAANWEAENHGKSLAQMQSWWGHCNGWAAAACLFPEPRGPKSVDGATFSVADQKALLTEAGMEVSADFFGMREDDPSDFSSPTFNDVYPDQFFLVLLNRVGKGLPLVMDRYTGYQVWNHPIVGYQVSPVRPEDYLGTDPSAPKIHRVMVETQLWWARDDVAPSHVSEPFAFQDGPSYDSRILRFELWLDGPPRFDARGQMQQSGNVVLARQGQYVMGGAWRNGNLDPADSHPDYLWIPYALQPASGYANPAIDAGWVRQHLAG